MSDLADRPAKEITFARPTPSRISRAARTAPAAEV
jgi:hypothetical protein